MPLSQRTFTWTWRGGGMNKRVDYRYIWVKVYKPAKFTQVFLHWRDMGIREMRLGPVVAWIVRFLSEFL